MMASKPAALSAPVTSSKLPPPGLAAMASNSSGVSVISCAKPPALVSRRSPCATSSYLPPEESPGRVLAHRGTQGAAGCWSYQASTACTPACLSCAPMTYDPLRCVARMQPLLVGHGAREREQARLRQAAVVVSVEHLVESVDLVREVFRRVEVRQLLLPCPHAPCTHAHQGHARASKGAEGRRVQRAGGSFVKLVQPAAGLARCGAPSLWPRSECP